MLNATLMDTVFSFGGKDKKHKKRNAKVMQSRNKQAAKIKTKTK
jgi:hypothetical protein